MLKTKVHLFIIVSIECSVNGINSLRGLTYLYFQVIIGWRRTADKLKGYLWFLIRGGRGGGGLFMEMQIVSFKPLLCMNSDDNNNLSLRFLY